MERKTDLPTTVPMPPTVVDFYVALAVIAIGISTYGYPCGAIAGLALVKINRPDRWIRHSLLSTLAAFFINLTRIQSLKYAVFAGIFSVVGFFLAMRGGMKYRRSQDPKAIMPKNGELVFLDDEPELHQLIRKTL